MRPLVVAFCCVSLLSGCARKRQTQAATPSPGSGSAPPVTTATSTSGTPKPNPNITVTAGHVTSGRVASVNVPGRFVVLTFPLGTIPPLEKRLNIYRGGLKVGEVKVTGPQLDINIDADIVAGECRIGDEVRDE